MKTIIYWVIGILSCAVASIIAVAVIMETTHWETPTCAVKSSTMPNLEDCDRLLQDSIRVEVSTGVVGPSGPAAVACYLSLTAVRPVSLPPVGNSVSKTQPLPTPLPDLDYIP